MRMTTPTLALLACAGPIAAALGQPEYDFVLVDSFNPNYGLRETYLWDINDEGVACGITTADGVFGYPGFYWTPGEGKTRINVTYPRGISNTRLLAGLLSVMDLDSGQVDSPPRLPGTYIGPTFMGINDAGVAVGSIQTCNCSNSAGVFQIPYLWDAVGGARTVGVPNAKGLLRINNAGTAIGWTTSSSSFNGFVIDLATESWVLLDDIFPSGIGTAPTRAYEINDLGEVVGTRVGVGQIYFYGYRYSPSSGFRVLPLPSAPYQLALKPLGINDSGTIVGEIYINGSSRGCVYTEARGIRDLNDSALVEGIPPGFTMMTAQKINNPGWIIGYGYGGGGMYKSFVLIPRSTCSADFNGDGFIDFFDYNDFVGCFETGVCPPGKTADVNGDGFVDFFDYDAYVAAFEAGC